jgi:hypothetical protein
MNQKPKPIGWVTTITSLRSELGLMWSSFMTIENSPLRKLDPRVSHMIFQCLAFVWSGLFAVMIGSYMVFGISAVFHICLITGIFVTAVTLNEADKRPQTFNRIGGYNGRGNGGEHE